LRPAVQTIRDEAQARGLDLKQFINEMSAMEPNRLQALVSIESLIEDLDIIENSAVTILDIKEGLIGPARQRHDMPVSLSEMIANTVAGMGCRTAWLRWIGRRICRRLTRMNGRWSRCSTI